MYGLLYIFNALLKPDAMLKPNLSKYLQSLFFIILGCTIIFNLLIWNNSYVYLVLGGLMSGGWVASYYSLILWNVPANHQPLAQMSMSFLDLFSAVIFFSKVVL